MKTSVREGQGGVQVLDGTGKLQSVFTRTIAPAPTLGSSSAITASSASWIATDPTPPAPPSLRSVPWPAAPPVDRHDDREAHRDLGGGHAHHEEYQSLSLGRPVALAEGDQGQVRR